MIFYRNQELSLVGNNGACPWRKRAYSLAGWAWIVMFFCLTGCETMTRNQKQADSHMEIGTAYIQSGKYNSALKELLQAEDLGKSTPKLHYLLGISYYGKGLNELAIGEMKKAVSMDPNYSEAHNFLGTIYLNMEKWDLAIESFEKALANILYDTPAMAHYNMGWAYYKKGNYDAALQQYALAIAQEPDTIFLPLIEKNRGIVLLAAGRTAEALKHLQKSVELVPSLAESYYWMGQCYIEQKNTEKANAAFQEAVKLAPETEWGEKSRKKIKALSSGG
jgi:type IV pilus assembly protein PilF